MKVGDAKVKSRVSPEALPTVEVMIAQQARDATEAADQFPRTLREMYSLYSLEVAFAGSAAPFISLPVDDVLDRSENIATRFSFTAPTPKVALRVTLTDTASGQEHVQCLGTLSIMIPTPLLDALEHNSGSSGTPQKEASPLARF